jgi:cystathionine beta-lyase/cystathionine gamma-synthase
MKAASIGDDAICVPSSSACKQEEGNMMPSSESLPAWSRDTILVHSGLASDSARDTGTPTIPPIHASTTFVYANADALDQAFEGKTPQGDPSFVYSRQGNPSISVLEEALAASEAGVGAVVFGSGMAAIHAALLAAGVTAGTKLLTSHQLFGPTNGLVQKVFAPAGVEIVAADLGGADAGEQIRAAQPDVVFVESISNPLAQLVDIAAVGAAAQAVGAITIVDNTIASPCLIQPITCGCDLVVHSATKYISGHGDSTGGVVVSAKNTLLDQLRLYRTLLGAILSPFEAHLLLRGVRTMALRVERQCDNALRVATFLQQHPAVATVHYVGLPEHPQHALATQLLASARYGGLMAFELAEQSRAAVYQCIDRLRLCLYATTLGDVFSMVSYPAVSSHRTLTEAERQQRGITAGCIRLSVGIEASADIIADLNQALSA